MRYYMAYVGNHVFMECSNHLMASILLVLNLNYGDTCFLEKYIFERMEENIID